MKKIDQRSVIGLQEWINLPQLGIVGLRAKIDTGAGTSSLHATDIHPFKRNGEDWVRFTAHLGTLVQSPHRCEARLVSVRRVKSSNGHTQMRYVIATELVLGEQAWTVEFTLACRKTMRYRALLGSSALVAGGFLVDPSRAYIQGKAALGVTSSVQSGES